MGLSRGFLLVAAVVAAISVAVVDADADVAPKKITVGGEGGKGWTYGVDYQEWADAQQFNVGDTLVFTFEEGMHNVIEVNAAQLQKCDIPNSAPMNTGVETFVLQSGVFYFACGVGDHCKNGNMKMTVSVRGKDTVTIDV